MNNLATVLLREAYHLVPRRVMFQMFGADPERVHEWTIGKLSKLPKAKSATKAHSVELAGIKFPNRVGLAAGMDKDGLAAHAWAHLGFGFAELGTVTAQGQPGNDKPRVFRLRASQAIINRMGFNNAGAQAMAKTLAAKGLGRGLGPIPLGISIGKTKRVALSDATQDYLSSLRSIASYADYVAINVSSPNTPGLRTLQDSRSLSRLVNVLHAEASRLADVPVPIFVKLAPDLTPKEAIDIVTVVRDSPAAGLIATNTTLSRDGIAPGDYAARAESGGLSGRPLREKALEFVSRVRAATSLPVIGVGGIMCPRDAAAMFDAGADLVQIYTGFIYEGPALIRGINHLR